MFKQYYLIGGVIMKICIIIALSLLFTSCPDPPNPSIWEEKFIFMEINTKRKCLFFFVVDSKDYDSLSQSITEYINKIGKESYDYIGVFGDYPSINTIKNQGYNLGYEYIKYASNLLIPEENTLFNSLEKDKSKTAYYLISVYDWKNGEKSHKLYFRQDKFDNPIDVLVVDTATGETTFQCSFEPNPQYVYLPERDVDGNPL